MSNGFAPQTPVAPKKKGLSPIVWVLIGCGALLLLGMLTCVGGVSFLGYKAKNMVKEMEQNPAAAVGKMIAATNPDIEFVSADEAAKTVTFREVKTGKEVTFSVDDLKEGKFSITTDEGTVKIDANGENEKGGMTITGPDGSTALKINAGSDVELPSWVPSYPGGEVTASYVASGTGGGGGTVAYATSDSTDNAYSYYRDQLEQSGFKVTSSTETPQGKMLTAQDGAKIVTVIVAETDGKTQISLSWTGQ